MRRWFLVIGLLNLAGSWLSMLTLPVQQIFLVHMIVHVTVIAVAAPLIALGVSRTRFDPVCVVPALFKPIPVSLLEFLVVWGWHAPALHHAARQSLAVLLLEQISFLLVGLLLWLSVFGGAGPVRSARAASGVIALLLTSMHMTLLGALLALAPRALYEHGGGLFHLTPLEDQQLGGVIMLLVGGIVYLSGGLYLLVQLLNSAPQSSNADFVT